jgi:MFS family permease
MHQDLSQRHFLRRDLRYSSIDCFLSSAMVGAGETFLPAFVLFMGDSQAGSGLITALPFMIGSCVQLATPWALERAGSYRKWIVLLSTLQAFCFLPLYWLALRGPGHVAIWSLYLVITMYWTCGLGSAPAWNAWLALIVPEKLRACYFAKRNYLGQMGLVLGLLFGGFWLEGAKAHNTEMVAFASLFIFSFLARLGSSLCLMRQSEPAHGVISQQRLPLKAGLKRVLAQTGPNASGQTKFFGFLLFFAVAVNFSSPFFNAFSLKQLHLSYGLYVGLSAAALVAKIGTFGLLNRSARNMDPFKLMRIGLIGAALTPAMWVFSSNYFYLVASQVFSGALWAIYELGLMLALFGVVRDEERTSVLSLFNFASAAMILLGTLMGGQVLTSLGETPLTYYLIFGVSSAARLLSIPLFDRAIDAIRSELRVVVSESPAIAIRLREGPKVG